jgi:C-terminal processing protease CtpA/Prc
LDFKQETDAVLIGEPTGGMPNHFGEVRSFTLPNNKLKVRYSTKYFKKVEEDVSTITPDIEIETFFNDYRSGIDPVWEYIKKIE